MGIWEIAARQLELVGSPLYLAPFSAPVIFLLYVFSELVDVPKGQRFSLNSIRDFININIWVFVVFAIQFMVLLAVLIFYGYGQR